MLCDEIVADQLLRETYGPGWVATMEKIKEAQKFILSPEYAEAADGLVDNFEQLDKLSPWCRTPYPITWIEFSHRARPHWNPEGKFDCRPVDPTRHQSEPKNIGLLLQQQGRASRWTTHLFWDMRGPVQEGLSQNNGSMGKVVFDAEVEGGLAPKVSFEPSDFSDLLLMLPVNVAVKLAEYAREDWGGEVRFMTAVLGLLAAKNVAVRAPVDNARYNAKRAKKGRAPLFSYTVLKVRPTLMVRAGARGPGDGPGVRMHFVTGHFKTRKSGVYWWNSHARGSLTHGFAQKDYEL